MASPDLPFFGAASQLPAIAGKPDFSVLPRRVDKRTGAMLVTTYKFPVSARALQDWPLSWIIVNGKAICDTTELFDVADQRLAAARHRAALSIRT
jgi:hypothetical protein